MAGLFATRCAFPPETTRSERERELRGLLQLMAYQNPSPLTVPVPIAVPMAVPKVFCVHLDRWQWKRDVPKLSFQTVQKIKRLKIRWYRCYGEHGKKMFVFLGLFVHAAVRGGTCALTLKIVNTLIKNSSRDDRPSISTKKQPTATPVRVGQGRRMYMTASKISGGSVV